MDAVRLAVGTLTALPTAPPHNVDHRTWGRAILLAPLVGAVLGTTSWALAWGVADSTGSSLLAGTCAVGVLAALTRGLHLDGLADTADALGSGRPPAEARTVMQQSDIGPFGVVAVVVVVLVQCAAVQVAFANGTVAAALGVIGAAMVSRSAVTAACRRGVPALSDGLGARVVGSVSTASALSMGIAVVCLVALAAGVSTSPAAGAAAGGAALGTLLLAELWRRHCVRRLGAVTGDVLGSLEEVAFTGCLVGMVVAWPG